MPRYLITIDLDTGSRSPIAIDALQAEVTFALTSRGFVDAVGVAGASVEAFVSAAVAPPIEFPLSPSDANFASAIPGYVAPPPGVALRPTRILERMPEGTISAVEGWRFNGGGSVLPGVLIDPPAASPIERAAPAILGNVMLLELEPETMDALRHLAGDNEAAREVLGGNVVELVRYLARSAAAGVLRPDSWERRWIEQAFGPDATPASSSSSVEERDSWTPRERGHE